MGKVTEGELARMGIRTIKDLRRIPRELLVRSFGAHGDHLFSLARGIDDRPVETERETKSIGHEETYDHDLRYRETMRREILALSGRVSERLRREVLRGKTVTLKVKYGDFVQVTRAITLADPTNDGGTIYRCALDLLSETEAGARPVRLLGVSVSRLEEAKDPAAGGRGWSRCRCSEGRAGSPRAAPIPPDPAKKERLNRAVDRIREKFGPKGIVPGALPGGGRARPD